MNDWGGYKAIIEEAKQIEADEKKRPLIDCPLCGTPLQKNARGAVNCPLGHFRQESDARR